MASIGLTSRASVSTALAGRRIPRHAWSDVQDLANVLHEANTTLAAARQEAGSIIQAAREQGYATGLAAAQAEAVSHLLEAQHQAREFIAASEERVASLAIAILLRIAPKLGTGNLVAALVHEALSSMRAERHLRIRVAPQALEATQTTLEQWRHAHPEVETVTVEASAGFAPFACVVESELGHIEVGLDTQLSALRDALTAMPAESRSR